MTYTLGRDPRWVDAILDSPGTWRATRIILVSSYLLGGVTKLLDFHAAAAEQAHFGLHPGWLWAVLAILVELVGSVLVITGRAIWLGAGALGCLTFIAMLVASNFWSAEGAARSMALNTFFEHCGLIAGLVLAAIHGEMRCRPLTH